MSARATRTWLGAGAAAVVAVVAVVADEWRTRRSQAARPSELPPPADEADGSS
jgi:hypothetical protein